MNRFKSDNRLPKITKRNSQTTDLKKFDTFRRALSRETRRDNLGLQ